MSGWEDQKLIEATRRQVLGYGGLEEAITKDSDDYVDLRAGVWEIMADGGNVMFQVGLRSDSISVNGNGNPTRGAVKLADGRTFELTLKAENTTVRVEPDSGAWCTFVCRSRHNV